MEKLGRLEDTLSRVNKKKLDDLRETLPPGSPAKNPAEEISDTTNNDQITSETASFDEEEGLNLSEMAESMKEDSKYVEISKQLEEDFLKREGVELFSEDYQAYLLGSLDPKKREIMTTLDKDAEALFRKKYPRISEEYDEREKTKIYEDIEKDPFFQAVERDIAKRIKEQVRGLDTREKSFEENLRRIRFQMRSRELEIFVYKYPEKAEGYAGKNKRGYPYENIAEIIKENKKKERTEKIEKEGIRGSSFNSKNAEETTAKTDEYNQETAKIITEKNGQDPTIVKNVENWKKQDTSGEEQEEKRDVEVIGSILQDPVFLEIEKEANEVALGRLDVENLSDEKFAKDFEKEITKELSEALDKFVKNDQKKAARYAKKLQNGKIKSKEKRLYAMISKKLKRLEEEQRIKKEREEKEKEEEAEKEEKKRRGIMGIKENKERTPFEEELADKGFSHFYDKKEMKEFNEDFNAEHEKSQKINAFEPYRKRLEKARKEFYRLPEKSEESGRGFFQKIWDRLDFRVGKKYDEAWKEMGNSLLAAREAAEASKMAAEKASEAWEKEVPEKRGPKMVSFYDLYEKESSDFEKRRNPNKESSLKKVKANFLKGFVKEAIGENSPEDIRQAIIEAINEGGIENEGRDFKEVIREEIKKASLTFNNKFSKEREIVLGYLEKLPSLKEDTKERLKKLWDNISTPKTAEETSLALDDFYSMIKAAKEMEPAFKKGEIRPDDIKKYILLLDSAQRMQDRMQGTASYEKRSYEDKTKGKWQDLSDEQKELVEIFRKNKRESAEKKKAEEDVLSESEEESEVKVLSEKPKEKEEGAQENIKEEIKDQVEVSNEEGKEESEEEVLKELLGEKVSLLHEIRLEAQRKLALAKNEVGVFEQVRLKTGFHGENEKEVLEKKVAERKEKQENLKKTENNFEDAYNRLAQKLTKEKKAQLFEEERKRLSKEGLTEDKIGEGLEEFKKGSEFTDALLKFITSEKVVFSKDKEGKEIKLSLIEDLNKKIKEANSAHLEALGEKEKGILKKAWESYGKLSKGKKLAIGLGVALSLGLIMTPGATASAGAAAMTGGTIAGRKILSFFAGGAAGAISFKETKEHLDSKRKNSEKEKYSELVLGEGENGEFPLYELLKNNLKKEKQDLYKSLAAAGITGVLVGGASNSLTSALGSYLPDGNSNIISEGINSEKLEKALEVGTLEVPPEFSYLKTFDSFQRFLEKQNLALDSSSGGEAIDHWEKYRILAPQEIRTDASFKEIDDFFEKYSTSSSDRVRYRVLNQFARHFDKLEREYEMRIHGAELMEKMEVEFDPFADSVKGEFEGGVLTKLNGRDIPLTELSEDQRSKVEVARKIASKMNSR